MKLVPVLLLLTSSAYAMDSLDEGGLGQSTAVPPVAVSAPAKSACSEAIEQKVRDQIDVRHPILRSEEQVAKAFQRNMGRMQAIYQRHLREAPCSVVVIDLTIELSPEGVPTAVLFEAVDPRTDAVAQKISATIGQLKFGPAPAAEKFTWRLSFYPS